MGKAVGTLGAADGFFGNKEVKIPLPKSLQTELPPLAEGYPQTPTQEGLRLSDTWSQEH